MSKTLEERVKELEDAIEDLRASHTRHHNQRQAEIRGVEARVKAMEQQAAGAQRKSSYEKPKP